MNLLMYWKLREFDNLKLGKLYQPLYCRLLEKTGNAGLSWPAANSLALQLAQKVSLLKKQEEAGAESMSIADSASLQEKFAALETQWAEKLKSQRRADGLPAWVVNSLDFFLIVPVYMALYYGILQAIVEPLQQHLPLSDKLSFSAGDFLQCLVVYIIIKGLMRVFFADVSGSRRWLALAGLFVLYLAGIYVSHQLSLSLSLPLWLFLAGCALCFAAGYAACCKVLELSWRKEKRI